MDNEGLIKLGRKRDVLGKKRLLFLFQLVSNLLRAEIVESALPYRNHLRARGKFAVSIRVKSFIRLVIGMQANRRPHMLLALRKRARLARGGEVAAYHYPAYAALFHTLDEFRAIQIVRTELDVAMRIDVVEIHALR